MDRVEYQGKRFVGQRIYDGNGIQIYQVNRVQDKYIVFNRRSGRLRDFNVTGTDQICEILKLAERDVQDVRREVSRKLESIKEQTMMKKLHRPDPIKLRKQLSEFWDQSYPLVVVAGLHMADIEQEMTFS